MAASFSPFRSILLGSAIALIAVTTLPAQDVQGLVQPVKQVSVSSPVIQEVVEEVLVEEGDVVKKDQPLVILRKVREELAVREASKMLENARFIAKGTESLAKEKMGSLDQALKAKTEMELTEIRKEAAEHALREKTVTAPLSGVVVKKYKEAGESIDRAEKLVDIVNIDQVYVQFYLDPKLMPDLRTGQTINVRFPVLNNSSVPGKIDFVDPRIDASSGLFRVKVLIDNQDQKIKAGMRGLADFTKRS